MRIVIVGDGKVGSTLARQLSTEGHDVVIIDNNAEVLRGSTDKLDVIGVLGDGADSAVQKEAGTEKADLLIAATSSDERNLICCLIGKKLGARRTIARVRNPAYSRQMHLIGEELGLSMAVNPDQSAAQEIARSLRYHDALKVSPFAQGQAELVETRIAADSPLCGLTLRQLRMRYALPLLVCAVQRGDTVVIPKGDFVLTSGDRALLLAAPGDFDRFFTRLHSGVAAVSGVMIAGGSRIAYYLAQELESTGVQVKIIDRDAQRCRELGELLPKAEILLGDAREHDLLLEEGLARMDAFVALTGLDEENIIASVYAASCKVPKIVTKVNDGEFASLMGRMGLDIVISPKTITASIISRYVRAMKNRTGAEMEALYTLLDGKVEGVSFKISGDFPYLGIPLRDLKLRPDTLIACVVRDGKTLIAGGETVLAAEDRVICIAPPNRVVELRDLVTGR